MTNASTYAEYMVSYQLFNGLCGNFCFKSITEANACARLNWGAWQSVSIFGIPHPMGYPNFSTMTLIQKVK